MNKGFKKLGKGLFAIFMIKAILISGVIVFQSCQKEDTFTTEEQTQVKNRFLNVLRNDVENFKNVSIKNGHIKGDLMKSDSDSVLPGIKLCLLFDENSSIDSIDVSDIDTVGGAFDLSDQIGVRTVLVDNTTNLPIDDSVDDFGFVSSDYCFDIPEQPTATSMQTSLNEAKNYFYSKGMTDAEINEILDGNHESALVPLALALIVEEDNMANSGSGMSMNYMSLFGSTATAAMAYGGAYDCLLRSFGITAVTEAINAGFKSDAGKRALKKAVRKIAARTLSWIGAAWAVYEFVTCMWF